MKYSTQQLRDMAVRVQTADRQKFLTFVQLVHMRTGLQPKTVISMVNRMATTR